MIRPSMMMVPLLAACVSRPLAVPPLDAASLIDAAAPTDAAPTIDALSVADASEGGDMGDFCGNQNSAQVEVNGIVAASPAVSATPLYLNCCDGAAIEAMSQQLPATMTPVVLEWQHTLSGSGTNLPVTLDLAHLPEGWLVTVSTGCGPMETGCSLSDTFTMGLTGTLTISTDAAGNYTMSTCMTATESADSPHTVVHSLKLWAPTVTTD